MHKKTLLFLSALVICLIGLSGCDTINPSEEVPSIVHIDDVDITVQAGQGTADDRITDVWVFAGNELLGAFPLPADIPVYGEGPTELTVLSGIKDNGIRSTPKVYNFYEPFDLNLDLQRGRIDTLSELTTKYVSNAIFAYIEDFETLPDFKDLDGDGSDNFSTTPDGFEGRAGVLQADTFFPIVTVANELPLELPTDGSDVYIEMNYKSEVEFQVGLVGILDDGTTAQQVIITLFEKEDWNKIYISLGPTLLLSGLNRYQVFFRAILPIENGAFVSDRVRVHFDNIKLVHF